MKPKMRNVIDEIGKYGGLFKPQLLVFLNACQFACKDSMKLSNECMINLAST